MKHCLGKYKALHEIYGGLLKCITILIPICNVAGRNIDFVLFHSEIQNYNLLITQTSKQTQTLY